MAGTDSILIIVESPTKAKTIRKFLGKECKVLACMGHVRDLPRKAGEIPADLKKLPWAKLGVNVEKDFEPLYIVPPQKNKTLTEIRKAMKDAEQLYLATDEDREGESISWHLIQVLKPKIPTKRMVFHEITAPAIREAFANPRDLDMQLVHAQEARRILDRLVGYTISPLIWKKIAFGLSAGRVQSVAVRALVELEKERMLFRKAEYWGLNSELSKSGSGFEARLTDLGAKKVAIGKDFSDKNGKLLPERESAVVVLQEAEAKALQAEVKGAQWKVTDVEEKPVSRKPAPPFITSTLQQEANRKLGLSAKETMRIAQSLYEKGFITYMRTDSVNLSQAAIEASRHRVEKLFGKSFLSETPRVYKTKAKAAQEAHEAIRPSLDFTAPSEMPLLGRDKDVYELIWMRTVATQMADASQMQISAAIEVPTKRGAARFYASGMKIIFPGFLKAYVEGSDDADRALAERERYLPDLKVGDVVKLDSVEPTQHETKPPARFTEATLIQLMEKEGIGRPSTYAAILSTVVERGYVKKIKNMLVPTFTGFAVTKLMSKHFSELVDFKFTSQMEDRLDQIASGELDYIPYLREFYSSDKGLQKTVEREDKRIDPDDARSIKLDHIPGLDIHIGKFGPYFEYHDSKSNTVVKASVPEDMAPADLNVDSVEKIVEQVKEGPKSLAVDPNTKQQIYLRSGSYGPYLQLGDGTGDKTERVKRVSIPKMYDPATVTPEMAIILINLPRKLGKHPTTGKDIVANTGRFGPYVMHDGDFRSLKKEDSVLYVDFARAMEIFSVPKKSRRRGTALKDLGEEPVSKQRVEIFDGPYGHYLKVGKTNVSIPKEMDFEKLTLAEALILIGDKATAEPKAAKGAKRATKAPATKRRTKAKADDNEDAGSEA